MTPHTESSTLVDTDLSCFEKARAKGMPTFTLIAQDILSPLTIDFWVKANQKARELMATGLSAQEAERAVRAYYFLDTPDVPLTDRKLAQACSIAGAMEKWPNRRLAD